MRQCTIVTLFGKPTNNNYYEFGAHAHMQSHVFQNNKYPILPLFVPSFFTW